MSSTAEDEESALLDDELLSEDFRTVGRLEKLIESKINAK